MSSPANRERGTVPNACRQVKTRPPKVPAGQPAARRVVVVLGDWLRSRPHALGIGYPLGLRWSRPLCRRCSPMWVGGGSRPERPLLVAREHDVQDFLEPLGAFLLGPPVNALPAARDGPPVASFLDVESVCPTAAGAGSYPFTTPALQPRSGLPLLDAVHLLFSHQAGLGDYGVRRRPDENPGEVGPPLLRGFIERPPAVPARRRPRL